MSGKMPMDSTLQLIASKDLPSTSWKNGGGSTREIAVFPSNASFDDFVWRVSLAEVEQAGAFSSFSGIDRQIVLTLGQNMILHNRSTQHSETLHPFKAYAFAGEDIIDCELPTGPTSDFNLMVRRDQATGSVSCWNQTCEISLNPGHYLFHSALGGHQLRIANQNITLGSGDSLYFYQNTKTTSFFTKPINESGYLIAAHVHLVTT